MDEALRVAPVDPDRLGITGWSYGGYMTMWAVTQTNRFKAAVAGAGIANYQSYYGENLIDQWMIPYFGRLASRQCLWCTNTKGICLPAPLISATSSNAPPRGSSSI